MSIPFSKREKAIKDLFEYEESHNVPKSERLTYDPYKDNPDIPEPSPRKKAYVDIRDVIHSVKEHKK